MADKSWYAARLLFVSGGASGSEDDRLCEESIILVRATDEPEALRAADQVGRTESEVAYRNEDGDLVEWRFLGVAEVQDLCESRIDSGTEVYSRLFFESQIADDELRNLLETQPGQQPVPTRP